MAETGRSREEVRRRVQVQQEIQSVRSAPTLIRHDQSEASLDGSQAARLTVRGDLNNDDTGPSGRLADVSGPSPIYARAVSLERPLPIPLASGKPIASNTLKINPIIFLDRRDKIRCL